MWIVSPGLGRVDRLGFGFCSPVGLARSPRPSASPASKMPETDGSAPKNSDLHFMAHMARTTAP